MYIDDFNQIGEFYRHVYLSPHLDDAALSCGGAIALQCAAGERVLVITLCTATPAVETVFSDLALAFHRTWQLNPAEVVAVRLDEDRLAMTRLGADYHWAGLPDALYRHPQAYHSLETLFGSPARDDPQLPALRQWIGALRGRVPNAIIYAPLAVGNHVDHQITYQAILDCAGPPPVFYEDIPYAIEPGALDRRLATLGGRFSPTTIAIDTTLQVKIDAIKLYASQLDYLFEGEEAMARTIAGYAQSVRPANGAYAERLWVQQPHMDPQMAQMAQMA